MTDLTLTEMRKDLFRIIDTMIERGEPVRLRRGGVSVELVARVVETPADGLSREDRLNRMMALGPRPGFEQSTYDPSDNSHWEWDPDKKFKDLLEP